MTTPTITVAVPTFNRARDVARCLDSLSQVKYPAWEVLVIDQSDSDDTRLVVERMLERLPQTRYYHMTVTGLTRGRNLALRSACGEILAFIDDDCTVDPTWLQDVASTFRRHPEIPLVFGQVHPALHNRRLGFIVGHEMSSERVLERRLSFLRAGSIMGASMYLRRRVCRSVGPFDVYAGPGARFNIEDREYAYRVLSAGYPVLLTPAINVVHHGMRYYADPTTQELVRSYAFGYGAQDMKFVRCGDSVAPLIVVGHVIRMIRFIRLGRLALHRGRASHASWTPLYLAGMYAGRNLPVMRQYQLWGSPADYDPVDLQACRGELVTVSATATSGQIGRQ